MSKNKLKKIAAILVASVSALSFAGCYTGDNDLADEDKDSEITVPDPDIGGETTDTDQGGSTTNPDPDDGETTDTDQGGSTTNPDPDDGETTDTDEGGSTTNPDPDDGETTDTDQGGSTTTPDPDDGETTDTDQGGSTTNPDPDDGETTDTDEGGSTTNPDPDDGETTDTDEGGSTTTPDPDDGETTDTDEGGSTTTPDPDEGETTDPDQGGSTTTPDPDDGETTDPDEGGSTTTPDPDEGETTDPDEGGSTTDPDPDEGLEGGGETKPDPDTDEDDEPEITVPVAGAVEIITAAGDLEAAYITWEIDEAVDWYNVYCKAADAADSAYVKLDGPLVRKYSTYFRADAVGLAAGKYSMKVVPVDADGNELSEYASEANNITVLAHDRSGYAFVNGTSSGAYNEDGTLKSNARVIYITEETKDTVSLEVTGANENPCVGLQNILYGYQKGKETRPLAVRLLGNITDFAVMDKGDILISNKNNATAGITFEGIGSDATANGWGVRVKTASNIEIRNLGFMNCDSDEGDNIGLQQDNDHVWVHNCDLFYGDAGSDADQVKGDGALDTKKSTYITHSYNHFWDSGKCNLQGMKDEETSNYITYHHNWYDHSDSRHPRIRTCTVHIYNNYFDGNAKYGVGVTMGASAFVENNYFRSTTTLKPMMSSMQGTDAEGEGTFSGEDGGIIKAYGNVFDVAKSSDLKLITYQQNSTSFDVYEASSRDEQVPSSVKTLQGGTTYNNFDTASDFYEYEVDTAEVAKEKVEKYAGRIGGGDLQYDFNDATEDGNYSVISELKQMLVNYKSDLVQVGGGSVIEGSGSSEGGSSEGGSSEGGSTEGGTEQGGSTGGGTTEPSPAPVEGATYVAFDGGANDYTNSSVFTIEGSTNDEKGSVVYNGVTYTTCLKLNSDGSISFRLTSAMKLELYCDNSDGNSIKINEEVTGSKVASGLYSIELQPGDYTITKGSGETFIFVVVLSPVA